MDKNTIKFLSDKGCKITEGRHLSELCSFRIGGPADFFIEIPHGNALSAFLNAAGETKTDFFVIGGGTNILFPDAGYRGVIVKLTGDFEKISIQNGILSCGAGANLSSVVAFAAGNSLSGLECCAGIPGTAGGAVFGNAGSKDKWIGDCVESVEIYKNGKKELIDNNKIGFEYRKTALEGCIVSKINFSLKKEAGNDILKEVSDSIEKRRKTQPLSMPNAGCIFKNPDGLSAGKLIEDAGLKGKKKGGDNGAQISEIHGNFIVNAGKAKAIDVLDLIYAARKGVKEKFNIDLELEIKVM